MRRLPTGMIGIDMEYNEMVNHPAHYNVGRIETIDYIEDCLGEDGVINFCLGNALKYISRANYKGKFIEDLKKAVWYLEKAIETSEYLEVGEE